MGADCKHKKLKRQVVGESHWYQCTNCPQKFLETPWDGKVEVVITHGRPMESAPKDGSNVLLLIKSPAGVPDRYVIAHWMRGGHCIEDHPPIDAGWYFWNGSFFDKARAALAWMPLSDESQVVLKESWS